MEVVSKLVSVSLVLTVLNSANAQLTGNVEQRLRKLEEKVVERDNEIQRLKNMVEALYQPNVLDQKINVSLNFSPTVNASVEYDVPSDNGDIGSQFNQGKR